VQAAGKLAQHLVAGAVAMAIVDRLEPVEIEHHRRQAPAADLMPGYQRLQMVVGVAPIV
jgi:hypothetical protein